MTEAEKTRELLAHDMSNKEKVFSPIRGLSEKEVEELYRDYAKSFGDCEAPVETSARHGSWELVGHGKKTNDYCGTFLKFKICNRVELHAQSNLDGVSHAGKVFVHKIHRSCNSPRCPVCCFSGWAKREADKISQRIAEASKHYGDAEHIIIPVPESDYGLAEFHNDKLRVKVKDVLFNRGVVGGCLIFHGFRYADYLESIEKDVLFGWRWSPHFHSIGFILGGYGKCRSCSKLGKVGVYSCAGCNGFEARTRRFYEKDNYLVKIKGERKTIFGTAWYQLNHSAIKVSPK
jgi:hypothetical protein